MQFSVVALDIGVIIPGTGARFLPYIVNLGENYDSRLEIEQYKSVSRTESARDEARLAWLNRLGGRQCSLR